MKVKTLSSDLVLKWCGILISVIFRFQVFEKPQSIVFVVPSARCLMYKARAACRGRVRWSGVGSIVHKGRHIVEGEVKIFAGRLKSTFWVEFIPTLTIRVWKCHTTLHISYITRLYIYLQDISQNVSTFWIIIKIACINIRFVVYGSFFYCFINRWFQMSVLVQALLVTLSNGIANINRLSLYFNSVFKLSVGFRDSLVQRLVCLPLLISIG